MGELLSKYELLDSIGKQDLLDYLDFLISKRDKKLGKAFNYEVYRNRILAIGTWSDDDLVPVDEARQLINNWKPQQW